MVYLVCLTAIGPSACSPPALQQSHFFSDSLSLKAVASCLAASMHRRILFKATTFFRQSQASFPVFTIVCAQAHRFLFCSKSALHLCVTRYRQVFCFRSLAMCGGSCSTWSRAHCLLRAFLFLFRVFCAARACSLLPCCTFLFASRKSVACLWSRTFGHKVCKFTRVAAYLFRMRW